jgi:hypothetical protein
LTMLPKSFRRWKENLLVTTKFSLRPQDEQWKIVLNGTGRFSFLSANCL